MRGPTRICGRRLMIAIWLTCSRFKASLQNRSFLSLKPSFRPKRKQPSSKNQLLILLHTIFHTGQNTHREFSFKYTSSGEPVGGYSPFKSGSRTRSRLRTCLLPTCLRPRSTLFRRYRSPCGAVGHGGGGDPVALSPTPKFRRSASRSRQPFVLWSLRL